MRGVVRGATVVLAAVLLVAGQPTPASPALAADPVHGIAVTGTEVAMFPAFDPDIERFAVTTGATTAGTVTVTATSSDPDREIRFNGVPDGDGVRTLTGLDEGDEISVFVEDSAGLARYTLVYLPEGFPTLERVTAADTLDELAPGHVLLTLGLFTAPSSFYETAVDVNGVPAFVRRTSSSVDLQKQPNGSFSVFRPTAAPGRTGFDLLELGPDLEPVRTWRTTDLVNTDPHDAILLPDGTAWLMAYEPNGVTSLVDAVIQHVAPDGTVLFQWSSAAYADETTVAPGSALSADYAHVNSFQVLPDGHLLASFRHLSSIYKIATHPDGGHAAGDVIWKLGGRDSDFDFPDGDVGPCAQHTARMLPNGNVLTFDNGSWSFSSEQLCVDQSDPTGPSVERASTRVVEFELDEGTGSATPVRSYAPGRFALFAGSSQPLADGSTMIGWAAETAAVASEISAAGELLWEIRDPSAGPRYFTYRAHKAVVPDPVAPEVTVTTPDLGAVYVEGAVVPAAFGCTDRGGSSLQSCTGTVDHGSPLDTATPGPHAYAVTASDGAGLRTTVTRTYTVRPAARPDAAIRVRGVPGYHGVGVYGTADAQRVRTAIGRPGGKATVLLRMTNDGAVADRLRFEVRERSPWFRMGGRCAAAGVSPVLAPGESWVCRMTVKRRPVTVAGRRVLVSVDVRSEANSTRSDSVAVRVRAVDAS